MLNSTFGIEPAEMCRALWEIGETDGKMMLRHCVQHLV